MKTKKKKSTVARQREAKRIQEKRRKKRSRVYTAIFYSVYGLTIAAMFVGLFWLSRNVDAYVKACEAAEPKYAAAAAARPFLERDYAVLSQCEDPAIFETETIDQYCAYMDELLDGREITYNEVFSSDENVKRFDVKADDLKIGEFRLRHVGDDPRFGFWQWQVDSLDTDVLRTTGYQVEAPEKSTVYVDDRALTRNDIIRRGIPEFETVELPTGSKVPQRCVYEFRRYFGPGQVRVVDQYGQENEVSQTNGRYIAAYNYDDPLLTDELKERVVEVVRRLSCYMSNDYGRRNLLEDVVGGSDAETYINGFDRMWIPEHKSYDFENMDVRHFVSYSEDCFSVEARYDFKIIYYTVDPETYPTAYRLYFRKRDGVWLLFNFELI